MKKHDNIFVDRATIDLQKDTGATMSVPLPSECPICHHLSQVKLIEHADLEFTVQAVYQCGYEGCRLYFVTSYKWDPRASKWGITNKYPSMPETEKFSKEIEAISPMFCKIYNQSATAISRDLEQIAGPGFRKAAEFLVKDYAIALKPNEEKAIKKKPLSSVINEYITDNRIKLVVERAVWIGNDETHYLKKWDDKDIQDLKNLIKLTVNFIESEALAEKYRQSMPEGKK